MNTKEYQTSGESYRPMKKGLVVGISLLFILTGIVPSIGVVVTKASDENNLVEVTSQVCGIEGYGDTTVKLTKQQYQGLEQYLVDFSTRLNQTTTREEAIPLFREAIVEFNKYGLLPKGMNVEQGLKVVSDERFRPLAYNFQKTIYVIHHKHSNTSSDVINLLCYFYAHTSLAFEDNIWELLALIFGSYDLKIFGLLASLMFEYSQVKPFRFMNRIWVAGPGVGGFTYYYFTVGLLGIHWGSDDFSTAYGFSGIKLTLHNQEAVYFGFAMIAAK